MPTHMIGLNIALTCQAVKTKMVGDEFSRISEVNKGSNKNFNREFTLNALFYKEI